MSCFARPPGPLTPPNAINLNLKFITEKRINISLSFIRLSVARLTSSRSDLEANAGFMALEGARGAADENEKQLELTNLC